MGTIKLIHLFMSIYDYFLSNGENERSAFEHTGQKFVAYGVDCQRCCTFYGRSGKTAERADGRYN